MAKIYTKKGDKGGTSLYGRKKVSKADLIVSVLGEIDELNASLGILHSSRNSFIKKQVLAVQSDLMLIGAFFGGAEVELDLQARIDEFEETIDKLWEEMPELKNFILPGGSRYSAHLHVSRAICRRVERSIAMLLENSKFDSKDSELVSAYINRLSDLLFALARYVNFKLGIKDSIWKS